MVHSKKVTFRNSATWQFRVMSFPKLVVPKAATGVHFYVDLMDRIIVTKIFSQ